MLGGKMPKYIVTGGASGDASIEIAGKTYAPGEEVEIKSSSDWLVKQGYVVAKNPIKKGAK
jgi:hypothetical protein